MTTSKVAGGADSFSVPCAQSVTATRTRNAAKERSGLSFISDLQDLQCLLSRWKLKANALASFAIQERFRDRRHPADPAAVEIDLVHSNDPVSRFAPVAFPHPHRSAETHKLSRSLRRQNDFSR